MRLRSDCLEKDVDGFHPVNFRKLTKGESIVPCTPQGIHEFFKEYDIDLVGKEMVIITKYDCRPMALLGLNHGAIQFVIVVQRFKAKVAKRADI